VNQIDLSDSNQQIAENLVQAIFSSPDPKQAAINVIHDLIDHPFLDDETHDELIQAAASSLGLTVIADEESE
jgi:hypothetical protein